MENKTTRRQFMTSASLAGLGLAALAHSPVKAALNEHLAVAVIGLHSRGKALAGKFAAQPTCRVKTVADVDKRYWQAAVTSAQRTQGRAPSAVQDFRRVLEDQAIDAVVIATPDHWHAPMAIEALKAGKHVYVEKPCSHNPHEGELLVAAARKYNRFVQMGTQRRSNALAQRMVGDIHKGVIGEVYYAKTWYSNARAPIGFGKVGDPPSELDFDLWQGPAPRTAYRSNIHPYNWHWFWTWGTGEALNNGTHGIDLARWAMNVDYPTRVTSTGGRFHYTGVDDWQCPDTQTINAEFGHGKMMVWEGFSCNRVTPEKTGFGVRFLGTQGALVFLDDQYIIHDKNGKQVKTVGAKTLNAQSGNTTDPGIKENHVENFLGAILGNNPLNAPIDEGHKSVLIPQLGNIALRTGTALQCDPKNGRIILNPAAEKLWTRDYESGWEPKI